MKMLNLDTLASLLNVKPKTIYGWVHLKKIPYYKFEGSLRFDEEEILRWIKTKKISTHRTKDDA